MTYNIVMYNLPFGAAVPYDYVAYRYMRYTSLGVFKVELFRIQNGNESSNVYPCVSCIWWGWIHLEPSVLCFKFQYPRIPGASFFESIHFQGGFFLDSSGFRMHHYQLLVTFASITSEVVAIELREIRLLDGIWIHWTTFDSGVSRWQLLLSCFFPASLCFCKRWYVLPTCIFKHVQVPEILANEASAWNPLY